MPPSPSSAEFLRYLNEIGWSELRPDAARSASEPEPVAASPALAATKTAPAVPAVTRPAADVTAPATLETLAAQAAVCRACVLCETRNKVVFGTGNPNAELMFVGEGPGAEEDRRGLPFVGAAGEKLNQIIAAIGFSRDEVYIANIVKCRPPDNRNPQPAEVEACRHFLARQIDLVRPKVIVALGKVAAQSLLGSNDAVTRMRGHWWEVRGVPMRVTYHPAALLRDSSLRKPTWEDMRLVRDRLRPPVT